MISRNLEWSYHYQKYTTSSCIFPMENCVFGYRIWERCGIFHDFLRGLTAPLSYAYRIIFGWCSSNAPLGFKDSPSHNQWISFRVTWRSSSGVFSQRKALRSIRFIRIQYPESESVPLEDLYRSTPTVAERKHAAWVWMEKAVGRITIMIERWFAVLSTRKQIWLSMPIYVKHEKIYSYLQFWMLSFCY